MSETPGSTIEAQLQAAEAEWADRYLTGPTRLRWTELPPQIGDVAPDFRLRDQTDSWRTLREFWSDGPALVLFWRHFGCRCSIARAERLAAEAADYVDAGATIVIVGQAEPERSAAYADEHDIEWPILSDPTYGVYEAYGLLDLTPAQVLFGASTELRELDPTAMAELVTQRRDEGRPMVDHPWQQPGEFLVDSSGVLQFIHRYHHCWDFPDSMLVQTVLDSLS